MQKDGGAGGLHYMSDGTLPTTVQEFHALAVSEGALLTMLNDAMVSLLLVGYEAMPNGVKSFLAAEFLPPSFSPFAWTCIIFDAVDLP